MRLRLLPLVGAAWAATILVLPAAAAAEPLEREHYAGEDSDTFTDTECGAPITIDYTVEYSGLFMLKEGRRGDPTPYLSDNYFAVETYTNVANGKTMTFTHQGLYKDVRVEHVEGTVYLFTAMEVGRPVVVSGPDGKTLISDRGRIEVQFLVDTVGDDDLDNDVWIADVDSSVAGPHPIWFGEADFCDALDVIR